MTGARPAAEAAAGADAGGAVPVPAGGADEVAGGGAVVPEVDAGEIAPTRPENAGGEWEPRPPGTEMAPGERWEAEPGGVFEVAVCTGLVPLVSRATMRAITAAAARAAIQPRAVRDRESSRSWLRIAGKTAVGAGGTG